MIVDRWLDEEEQLRDVSLPDFLNGPIDRQELKQRLMDRNRRVEVRQQ